MSLSIEKRAESDDTYLVGFDTEDDSRGNVLLFCFVSLSGSYYTKEREEALYWIRKTKDAHKRIELWATNLEYDLINLFGEERISECQLSFGKSYLVGARWKGVEFRDTLRHIPASVKDLGEMVNVAKREVELFDKRSSRRKRDFERKLIARCISDATITFRTAKFLREIYQEFGQKCRFTLPSTAYNVWRKNFWRANVSRPSFEIWEASLQAYYGGRTEAFAIGEFDNVSVIDAASMFPWAMVAKPFPLPWGTYERYSRRDTVRDTGLYHANVSCKLTRPMLPVRTTDGLIYPNGSFDGWYTGEELSIFREYGGQFHIIEGFHFIEECDPFTEYVSNMFNRKQSARGAKREMYKLLLNSLYGKFGQKGEKLVCIPREKFFAKKDKPESYRFFCGFVLYNHIGLPPPWGNNLWPAIITARARVRLYEAMRLIQENGGRVLYCDTDSVFYTGPQLFPKKAEKIGDFELRGIYKKLMLVGKKEYALQAQDDTWIFHAKGIPQKEREKYLITGSATYERPVRLRESGKLGLQANIWREVTKERKVSYQKRKLPDGTLTPITLKE